jgi:hypothetical protein
VLTALPAVNVSQTKCVVWKIVVVEHDPRIKAPAVGVTGTVTSVGAVRNMLDEKNISLACARSVAEAATVVVVVTMVTVRDVTAERMVLRV